MTCSNCGQPNPADARFCGICGSRLDSGMAPSAAPTFEQQAGRLPLRDLGQFLSETFNIYQRNPRPFLIIAFMPEIPFLIANVSPAWLSVMLSLIGVLAYVLAGPATIHAVAQQYLGREIDIGQCFRRAWSEFLPLIIAFIVIVAALLGSALLMFMVIGIPLFFYLLVIWFFAGQAIIIESKGPMAALTRSQLLVSGSWWRVFGIVIVFVLIIVLLSLITGAIVSLFPGGVAFILSAVLYTLLSPIVPIGATLVYLDLRARKEGYTLEAMASEVARG